MRSEQRSFFLSAELRDIEIMSSRVTAFAVLIVVWVGACNRDPLSGPSDGISMQTDGTGMAIDATGRTIDMLAPPTNCGTDPALCNGDLCVGGKCARFVFVTEAIFGGNLGGLDGADAKCQSAATAQHLPGTYKAWLSTTTVNASDRLTHFAGPYVLVNSVVVAQGWNQLALSQHLAPLNITETAFAIGAHDGAWTASDPSGAYAIGNPGDCSAWTYAGTTACGGNLQSCISSYGDPSQSDIHWTLEADGEGCWNNRLHLYCIQQ